MIRTVNCTLAVLGAVLATTGAAPAHARDTTGKPPLANQSSAGDTNATAPPADSSTPATAPTRKQCVKAHRESQRARQLGRLVQARGLARTCTSRACPGLVITDCARWLNELDEQIPSVVFEVRVDGHPNLEAQIYADGQPVEDWTRGEALRLDPGEHTFRFVLPPHAEKVERLVLAEGVRYRMVSAEFAAVAAAKPAGGAPPPPAPLQTPPPGAMDKPVRNATHKPVPMVVYPLLGVSVLGLVSFAGFGLAGLSEQAELEKTCAPDCSDKQLSSMRNRYLVADISLGVGAAALLGAGLVYMARPEQPMSPTVGLVVLPGGGGATVTMSNF